MGKVVSVEEILQQRPDWSAKGNRVVFLAGRFDLLHPGHIRLLEQARDVGDVIAVGVFYDESSEPGSATRDSLASNLAVTPANERAEIVSALAAVDFAFQLDSRAVIDFLRRFHPDAIVDGARPSSQQTPLTVGAAALGLKIIRVPLEPGHSTSRLIERITHLRA